MPTTPTSLEEPSHTTPCLTEPAAPLPRRTRVVGPSVPLYPEHPDYDRSNTSKHHQPELRLQTIALPYEPRTCLQIRQMCRSLILKLLDFQASSVSETSFYYTLYLLPFFCNNAILIKPLLKTSKLIARNKRTPVSIPNAEPETKQTHRRSEHRILLQNDDVPQPPSPRPIAIRIPSPLRHRLRFSGLNSSNPSPNAPAFIDAATGRRIFFSDLIQRTENLAASIRMKFGLSRGDSALILYPNSIHTPILYLSLFTLGVIVSPVNPVSTDSEIQHYIQLAKPVIAFATSDTSPKIPPLRYGTVILDSAEFESLMENRNKEKEQEKIKVKQSDMAAILYSSGTTGRIKGVALTHRNWIAAIASGFAMRMVRKTPPVNLCTVPLFHMYGFAFCLRLMAMAETMVIFGGGGRFDLGTLCRAIEKFTVTHVAVAPPVVVAMVRDSSELDSYNLSSLEAILCGGAPLRKSVIQKLRRRMPNAMLIQAYGLTETMGRVFSTVGRTESEVEGATGKLLPNCEAKIVDPETGAALPPFMTGELWVKGPVIMKGYVDDEEATAATLDSDGWLKTGDLCYINKEGFLFFVDRLKELIKYKGYQIAPAELENLLQSHPDIEEAAVVPFPDEEAGQIPMAFVVKGSRSGVCESQIMEFTAKQVAPYKRIRRVMFIDSLPKNPTGKVLRKELIKIATSVSRL